MVVVAAPDPGDLKARMIARVEATCTENDIRRVCDVGGGAWCPVAEKANWVRVGVGCACPPRHLVLVWLPVYR